MKLSLPYDARVILGKKRRRLYNPVFKLADILGFWRYPCDIDQNTYKREYGILKDMYWRYKSASPITKSEKGSKLEAYFIEMRRQIDGPLLPRNFQRKTAVALSAVGDLMPAKGVENSAHKFYTNVAEIIFNTDISIANLEFTLNSSRVKKKGWRLGGTREQLNALKGHMGYQYTVFNTANNHILDWGEDGFNTTHNLLEAEKFHYVGTNRSSRAQEKGLILSSNGIKFGFVAATYSLNGRPFPNGKDYLVNFIPFHRFQGKVDVSLLEEQISHCRSQDCDFIVVSLHWGMEFEFFPRQNQLEIAHHLIEYGADAIISHHTHNIQPYEFYQPRRDPHRIAPIFYGLGNLCSLYSAPYLALSLIVNFKLVKGYVDGLPKTLVERVNVTPVIQMEYECKGKTYLQVEKLCDLININQGQNTKEYEYLSEADRYADLVLGRLWRT